MQKYSFLIIALLIYYSSYSQVNSYSQKLLWSDTLLKSEFSDYKIYNAFYFEGAVYHENEFGRLPLFEASIRLSLPGKVNVTLYNAVYALVNTQLKGFTGKDFDPIKNTPVITVNNGFERTRPIALVAILPFRRNPATGIVERLVSFSYSLTVTPEAGTSLRSTNSYVAHSVLATGTWYKIAVGKDGIYKIDKSFLQTLGISTTSIDPRNIRIYGNGGGMLPEPNSFFRYDDLQENAIKVVGEEDGKFDDGDYVLFYGQSPDRWKYDAALKRFSHISNLYSKSTYYFITTDLGAGKRVQDYSSGEASNFAVNTFDDYAFHELDLENLLQSGRQWFGEKFDFETAVSVPFTFPNIVAGSQGTVTASVASRSIYASNSFALSVNGQSLIAAQSIPAVCADYTCGYANGSVLQSVFYPAPGTLTVKLDYNKNSQDAVGYLDYIEINVVSNLSWNGSQMNFRSAASMGIGKVSQFTISNTNSNLLTWDVTKSTNVVSESMNFTGNQSQFTVATDTLHEFVIFSNSEGMVPEIAGKILNQDLHSLSQSDLFIITPDLLRSSAEDLGNFHRNQFSQSVNVVSVEQIYNEFSAGAKDLSAIRDFIRMFYVRANGDSVLMPKYLLLFGDGSYDNKENIPGNSSLIPAYESSNSLSPTSSFVSDDFFGLLDVTEGGNILDPAAKVDIAIGRLPVNNTDQASVVINKIKIYAAPQSLGNWRNVLTFVADDEDNDVHINDCDEIATNTGNAHPVYNIDKIYLDAYKQVQIPGGARYPEVNIAINNQINGGTLLFNYVGHGGTGGLGHERIMNLTEIQNYTNLNKLTLFVTATCDFTVYDNPSIVSAGEQLLLNAKGGAIALVTTVRLVYSSANKLMNQAFMDNVFVAKNGIIPPLGEVFRRGKNKISGDTNNRKFTLIGDPAITLDYPQYNINTTAIEGKTLTSVPDTMKALQKVTVSGTINDFNGNVMQDFNGVIFPTIYDKPQLYQTLANDEASYVRSFVLQKNVIYNGKASVRNGVFSFSFIVPKDISYQFGYGKISYYADNGVIDASGYKNDIVIGGISDSVAHDVSGPQVKVYMNDERFVFGGITDPNPTILVKLIDSSGLNTVGTGIGHDITAVLDNDTKNTLDMNNFYSTDLDSYQSGEVRYPLTSLAEGVHTLNVKAWDVYNNSSQALTQFVVSTSASMALAHVLNYPNPFTTRTEFMFEHNMPGAVLNVMIQIYTVSGKLVKTMQQAIVPQSVNTSGSGFGVGDAEGGYRVNGIYWDGKDDYGDPIGKGVYVYKLSVRAANGFKADRYEKLVILK
ncbi:MAG: type IX secretion system sortase PorU [Chitinophagales bacterium]|nr:type IX secretion system sortase PorU [Chitinophagales bacterium]